MSLRRRRALAPVLPLSNGRRRPGHRHIVLTTEGTYPHFKGGVSTWCHILLQQMPEVDFTLWALMMNPFVASQYDLPDNVRHLAGVPMWGIEEPAEYSPELAATKVLALSRRNTESRVTNEFVPMLEGLIKEISDPEFDPFHFAGTLYNLHRWFDSNDYRSTFRSRATWDAAKSVLLTSAGESPGDEIGQDFGDPERPPSREEVRASLKLMAHRSKVHVGRGAAMNTHLPTVNDATEGMRWLYRLLMPLNFPVVQGDLVHSSGAAFCGIPGILSKMQYGTPLLVTEHGVYMREQYLAISRYGYPFYLKKFVIQMIAAVSRTCYALADQVSPVCHYNARWEHQNGVEPSRVKVIYNGVDSAVFSPRPVERNAAPTVVTVARIDPLKDVETFLRVADATRERIPGVRFLHFGPRVDPDYDRKVKDLWKSLNLQDTVEWRGVTDDPAGAYNQGDVVVLTSISEAFPYGVVEAMMCGRPVVSTDVGGVREALEGTGVLARPTDVAALTEGIVRLLELDPAARQELSDACRARALNLFTLDGAIEAYRSSYEELVSLDHRAPVVPAGPYVLDDTGAVAGGRPDLDLAPVLVGAPEEAGAEETEHDGSLRARLAHPDPAVRSAAAAELGEQAALYPDAVALLSQFLKDPNPMVRMTALSNIARLLGRQEEAG